MSGGARVYLVGGGPWDPGLLTLRGREVLQRAEVVVFDYLANPELVELARPSAARIPVFDPSRRAGERRRGRLTQDEITDLLIDHARAGRTVVRLKGGDPYMFGRGGEEAEALAAAGIPFEVVPGVTAALAAAAWAGIPLTHRDHGSTVAFCTGHFRDDAEDPDVDWGALAGAHTIVLYMAARSLARIAGRLLEAGRDPACPVALVRWASRPDQEVRSATLEECAAGALELDPPVLVIVGEVVALRDRLAWAERRPLHGRRVVVTRAAAQQGALADALREQGAQVLALPVIAFAPTPRGPIEDAVAQLEGYDDVVFTSANGVDAFLEVLFAAGRDLRAFAGTRVCAIGPATARRLADRGLVPDLVPPEYVAESLLDAMSVGGVAGRRVLIPRAAVARELLPDGLREAGAEVTVLPVYETVSPAPDEGVREAVATGEVDWITFTASSTVGGLTAIFDDSELAKLRASVKVACIGPVTADTARAAGFDVAVVAAEYTIDGLVRALAGHAGEDGS